jgi:hypothetical protein
VTRRKSLSSLVTVYGSRFTFFSGYEFVVAACGPLGQRRQNGWCERRLALPPFGARAADAAGAGQEACDDAEDVGRRFGEECAELDGRLRLRRDDQLGAAAPARVNDLRGGALCADG